MPAMTPPPSEAAPSSLSSFALPAERALPHAEEVAGLFGHFRRPLLRYVLTFGIAAGEGEEIVQETFLALFKHLKCGKSRHNLPGWIFRVCHNLSLRHKEKLRGGRGLIDSDVAWLNRCVDNSPNPEEQLLQAQRRKRLQSVLNALTEQDRCCICLRAEGLRYREIAEILGMSLGAVSMSLMRSLAKFERADQE